MKTLYYIYCTYIHIDFLMVWILFSVFILVKYNITLVRKHKNNYNKCKMNENMLFCLSVVLAILPKFASLFYIITFLCFKCGLWTPLQIWARFTFPCIPYHYTHNGIRSNPKSRSPALLFMEAYGGVHQHSEAAMMECTCWIMHTQ